MPKSTCYHFLFKIVDYKGEEIFKIDCEMSALHQYLSSLPTQFDMNDWNEIIQRALYLFENHPPETLDERQAQWQVKWFVLSPVKNCEFHQLKVYFN